MLKLDTLSQRFENFATFECAGSSQLYEFLSLKVAQDNDLLYLCTKARDGQPAPNLLFGSVHHLLLSGKQHELSDYFPSLTKQPKKITDSFESFKNFCEMYQDEIILLLQTKLVQTNEVRRCGYLYPCFSYIYSRIHKPLALIEIGTSAGLQLFWDRYRYSYNTGKLYGNHLSDVLIKSEIKGMDEPYLLTESPPVSHRFGLDLHINDVTDPEDAGWLNALIWPEHHERRELFQNAARYVNKEEVTFIEGDGVSLFPQIIDQISKDSMICVFHTHVANQIPEDIKHQLQENIKKIGQTRDIAHIYNNIWDKELHIDSFMEGAEQTQIVGETDGHGRWFQWKI
ncbi:DUF2332 domain-containing protein [Fictibacillus nanhaiensis]|uniref:DUF2332 domain-containing protein n=1 Tax=Fictibacillus nanhaiensis TaxID=742169 RepID=UPI001C968C4F|nr:DUF2332 domain-containing protein [Fictibacillus nanhaiensis]MBY6038032.1 DUF2332 domain-containing protein [Fictibacillus nanhaiensis]